MEEPFATPHGWDVGACVPPMQQPPCVAPSLKSSLSIQTLVLPCRREPNVLLDRASSTGSNSVNVLIALVFKSQKGPTKPKNQPHEQHQRISEQFEGVISGHYPVNKGFEANRTRKFTWTFGKIFVSQFSVAPFLSPRFGVLERFLCEMWLSSSRMMHMDEVTTTQVHSCLFMARSYKEVQWDCKWVRRSSRPPGGGNTTHMAWKGISGNEIEAQISCQLMGSPCFSNI